MSKFIINPDVKIVKSCAPPKTSVSVPHEPLCPTVPTIEDENFLENVDPEILFVDDSIEIKAKEPVQSSADDVEDEETEKNVKFFDQQHNRKSEAPVCFDAPPTDLSLQIPLPLEDLESLFFYEALMISKNTDKARHSPQEEEFRLIPRHDEIDEVGSACIMTEGLDDGNIMVYVTWHMTNSSGGLVTQETLSVVKSNLQTVHEKNVLRSCVGGQTTEKTIHIFADDNGGFRIIKTETKDGATEQWKSNVDWTQPGDYVSVGANVLLTRRLVLDKYDGCVQSWHCDIEGKFSLSQHWFQAPETIMVIDCPLEVQRINKLLISDNGHISRHSSFFLTSTSCLLKEVYSENSHKIHVNPFSELTTKNCIKDLHLNWESDIQLMSMYMEFKEKRKEQLKQQLEHPRMKSILRDYILCLVKSKPKSVMNFTVDFVRKLERDGNAQVYQTASRRHQQNSI